MSGPVVQAQIRWSASVDELKKNISEGIGVVDAMKASVDRTVQSLSGNGLFQAANKATAAVTEMGGATKLTGAEQDRVNALLDKAVEKYKAMGMTAPPAMIAIADATRRADEDTRSFEQRLTSAGSAARTIGAGLTAAITLPIVGLGAAALKASMDYESAFAGVKKTVSGTPQELAAINTQFREMALTTPVSAVGLAKIGEMAGQLGVQKSKIVEFTKTIVDISVATNLTADEAGSSFARLANVLKMPQDQFSNLGSAVVALGNFGASTEQEMMNMAQRISAAGATANMTAPQILGIANALSSVGIDAEAGGTAVSRVINKIGSDVHTGGGHLQVFAKVAGESAAQFSQDWRDNAGLAFSKFMQGLSKARESGGDQLLGLMDELGFKEVRLRNAFMSAANAGSLMADSINLGSKAFTENTELTRAAEERYKTTANQLKVLWNNLTDVAITIGDALTPKLNEAVTAIKPLVQEVSTAVKWFLDLPTPVLLAAGAIAAIAAAIGPLLVAFGGLAFTYTQISAALAAFPAIGTTVSGAFATMGGAVGLFTGALALVIVPLAFYEVVKMLQQIKGLHQDMQSWDHDAKGVADTFQNTMAVAARLAGHEFKNLSEATAFLNQRAAELRATAAPTSVALAMFAPHAAAATKALEGTAAGMAAATERAKQYAADMDKLGKAGQAAILDEHAHHVSLTELAKEFGVTEASLNRLVAEHSLAAAAARGANQDLAKMRNTVADLAYRIDLANNANTSYADKLKLFGPASEKAALAARAMSVSVEANVQEMADAWEQQGLDKLVERASKAIGPMAEKIFKDLEAAHKKCLAAINKDWLENEKSIETTEQEHYTILSKLEGDSLASRLAAVHADIEKRKAALNTNTTNGKTAYDALTALEKDKILEVTRAWQESQLAITTVFDLVGFAWAKSIDAIAAGLNRLGEASHNATVSSLGSLVGLLNATKKQADETGNRFGVLSTAFDSNADSSDRWAAAIEGGAAIGAGAMDVWNASANAGSKAAGALHGAMAGAKAGAVFGPWGMAIGAAAGALVGFIRNMNAGRNAVKDFANSFDTAAAGTGFDEMHTKLLTLGAAGEALWVKLTQGVGRSDPAAAKAVIAEITAAFEKQKAQIAADNDSLGQLLQSLTGLGAGKMLEPYLEKLTNAKDLTADNAALLQQLAGDGTADWHKIEEAVQRYGGDISKLGGTFQEQRLHASWQSVIDDMDLFAKGGISAGDALSLTKGKIIELAQQSQKFRTEVPENMRPWLQTLVDSGELVDANGQKIKDLSGLKFGVSLETSIQHLVDKISEFIDKLSTIPSTIATIPKSIDIDQNVTRHYRDDGSPTPGNGDPGDSVPAGMSPSVMAAKARVLAFPSPGGTSSSRSVGASSSGNGGPITINVSVDARGASSEAANDIGAAAAREALNAYRRIKRQNVA